MEQLIRQANELLKNQGFEYAFCGGWAIDLFLGKETRTHGDIDILAYWPERDKIIEWAWSQEFLVYEMLGGREGSSYHGCARSGRMQKKYSLLYAGL